MKSIQTPLPCWTFDMSRGFGSCEGTHLHNTIRSAADDCAEGAYELTRHWGAFFEALYPVAHAIASSEAHDWSEGGSILATIENLPMLRKALKDIEDYVAPFQRVASRAVHDALRKAEKERGE